MTTVIFTLPHLCFINLNNNVGATDLTSKKLTTECRMQMARYGINLMRTCPMYY